LPFSGRARSLSGRTAVQTAGAALIRH
jgi:hypothetical protein